ncbi:unnamed protein product [Microthlaspi erraticum]|uniref:HTH cro/C1-type domain-containing protein n=1 Tax=Microthlaspi erraticum TaxID=1685480 RepID=A0A6D2IN13_9BRAS|nr:unnamed protein product [Microthlaspi erraticum]
MEAKKGKGKRRRKTIGGAKRAHYAYACDVLHQGEIVPFPVRVPVPQVSEAAEPKPELRVSNELKGAIKMAREAKNLSQAQLAEMIGEHKKVVKWYEYGHPVLNETIISKMAEALGANLTGPINNDKTASDILNSIDKAKLTLGELGELAKLQKAPVIRETETEKAIRIQKLHSKMKENLQEAELAGSIRRRKPKKEVLGAGIGGEFH